MSATALHHFPQFEAPLGGTRRAEPSLPRGTAPEDSLGRGGCYPRLSLTVRLHANPRIFPLDFELNGRGCIFAAAVTDLACLFRVRLHERNNP